MGNKKKAVWPSIPPENSRTRPESLLPPHRSWLFWPHLSSCFPDSLTECISLMHFFNGKTLLTNTFVFIAGLWTKFSWPLSKYLSEWTGMQMLGPRLMASLKLSSLSHKKEVLHVGDLLQWKTKSFYKHVIIIIFFPVEMNTFALQTTKSGGWEGTSSCSHSVGIDPEEVLTHKILRWTAAFESETDCLNSRKQLCCGHFEIPLFWSNYVLAVKLTQLGLLSFFFFFIF